MNLGRFCAPANMRRGSSSGAEILLSHDLLDRLQRIALGTDRLQPALNIEKALLPHDPLAPSAHHHVRSRSQIRGDLARGIFRGAQTLVCTRGRAFPLAQLRERLHCPRCGSREVVVLFDPPVATGRAGIGGLNRQDGSVGEKTEAQDRRRLSSRQSSASE